MRTKTTLRAVALVAATMWLGACASLATPSTTEPSVGTRVVDGRTYRVLRADPLYLYERQHQELSGKRFAVVTDRFFSTSATAPLRPLTLQELKKAYPDNHAFHDILTLAFQGDGDLMRWDGYHHEYLVARLLRQSLAGGTAISAR